MHRRRREVGGVLDADRVAVVSCLEMWAGQADPETMAYSRAHWLCGCEIGGETLSDTAVRLRWRLRRG